MRGMMKDRLASADGADGRLRYRPGGVRGGALTGWCDDGRLSCGRGARISGADALTSAPVRAHAMRTDSGRPSSSIRFRALTAVATSVARPGPVREPFRLMIDS